MPQRRRTQGRSTRKTKAKRLPGWALLLLGLTLGGASVLMTQLVIKRPGSHDGLAALFKTRTKPSEPSVSKRSEPVARKPKLDFYTILPEIETVLPERNAKKTTPKTEPTDEAVRYILQAGSFPKFEDADQLKARLALQGLQAQIQKVTIEGKGEYHRVRLGPYQKLDELDAVSQRLEQMGIKTLRLRVSGERG